MEVRLDSKPCEGTARVSLSLNPAVVVQMKMKITLNLVFKELVFL